MISALLREVRNDHTNRGKEQRGRLDSRRYHRRKLPLFSKFDSNRTTSRGSSYLEVASELDHYAVYWVRVARSIARIRERHCSVDVAEPNVALRFARRVQLVTRQLERRQRVAFTPRRTRRFCEGEAVARSVRRAAGSRRKTQRALRPLDLRFRLRRRAIPLPPPPPSSVSTALHALS